MPRSAACRPQRCSTAECRSSHTRAPRASCWFRRSGLEAAPVWIRDCPELALARGEHDTALPLVDEALAQSRARGRIKYEALGLWARANAFAATGRTRKAVADLQRGLKLARRTSDPALFLRLAGALLALDQQQALADEAQSTAAQMRAALPTEELRRCFDASQPLASLKL